MSRRAGAFLAITLAFAVPASAAAPTLDILTPSPAQPSTARLVLAEGSGSNRVALWAATNSKHELCIGWTTGARSVPGHFICLRRGLERPLLTVEYGGGFGGVGTWGTILGLVASPVTRVSAETLFGSRTVRDLDLRVVPSLPGWRSFATGQLDHPTSTTLTAYEGQGAAVLQGSGASIHPSEPNITGTVTVPGGGALPVIQVPPPPVAGQAPTGPAWSDTFVGLGEASTDEHAISMALAQPAVASILGQHRAWLERTLAWSTCDGRSLGRIVSFRFARPATFTATLTRIQLPTQGTSAYVTSVEKVRATDWNELNVYVDMNARAIAGADSRSYAGPELGEGTTTRLKTIVPPHGAGGPDNPAPCSHD